MKKPTKVSEAIGTALTRVARDANRETPTSPPPRLGGQTAGPTKLYRSVVRERDDLRAYVTSLATICGVPMDQESWKASAIDLRGAVRGAVELADCVNVHDWTLKPRRVSRIRADVGVRYWEDGTINGKPDKDGSAVPLRDGKRWVIDIDVATGSIRRWPLGVVADVHYKVCDDGEYFAYGSDGKLVAALLDGYVPDFLSPEESGFGDYVIMKIDGNGRINKWAWDDAYISGWDHR